MEARLAGRAGAKEPAGLAIARVASVELAAQAGLAELAELAAQVGLAELAELAAQVGLAELAELAAQVGLAELAELAAQVGLAELVELAAQAGLVELVELAAQEEGLAELEIAQVAVLETKHLAAQAAVVLRTKSVTAARRRGLVPVPKRVEDLAAAAETTREPAATEAAKAWAAEE
jgi:hypothetical protein